MPVTINQAIATSVAPTAYAAAKVKQEEAVMEKLEDLTTWHVYPKV